MRVPLTVLDFIERAELVYGDRIGDRRRARPARRGAGRAHLGRGRRASPGRRPRDSTRWASATVNASRSSRTTPPACSRPFFGVSAYGRVLVPINFRLNADEIGYIVEHSGASVLLVDPELEDALAGVTARHRFVDRQGGRRRRCSASTPTPEPWIPDEDATATINYTSGTTARPKGVQLTHRTLWVNATTFGWQTGVSDRDVYLWTLPMFHCNGWGMSYAVTGMGGQHIVLRKVDGAEILRRVERHGVTFLCGAPAVVAAVLDAAQKWEGEIPGRGRVRMVVAGRTAADAHHRAHGDRARLGVHPDLRTHRNRAVAHDDARPRGVGRAHARGARAEARARGRARARACASSISDQGEVLRAFERRARGLLGTAGGDGRRARGRLVPHRRRRHRSTTSTTSRSATARRT